MRYVFAWYQSCDTLVSVWVRSRVANGLLREDLFWVIIFLYNKLPILPIFHQAICKHQDDK